jgi:tetratricopeptide (TPR) repeat protein
VGDVDLPALLAAGERAAFHGRPGDGVEPLRQAVEAAGSAGQVAEGAAAGWLLGVCLSSAGRYGGAIGVLQPLAGGTAGEGGPELAVLASLSASALASVHRQLGRHEPARELDEQALERGAGSADATFDARAGLAADAVRRGDGSEATGHVDAAAALVGGRTDRWRQQVRLGWLRAEVAMLAERPGEAVPVLGEAIDLAERSGAPRHVAKGLLFQGVAQVQVGAEAEATAALRRGALLAERLGALPLLWPTRALLGTLVAAADGPGSTEAARCLSAARSVVTAIAGDLPDPLRTEWLARPDVAGLLEA